MRANNRPAHDNRNAATIVATDRLNAPINDKPAPPKKIAVPNHAGPVNLMRHRLDAATVLDYAAARCAGP